MASLADEIPAELLDAGQKDAAVEWIRKLNLPRRFKRRLLQDWGAAVDVVLEGEDYARVVEY